MATIKKISLSDQLYEQLRARITNMQYPLGSRLNVSDLQETFGVSSTPIREAINRLQAEGLVTNESNVGASIISLSESDIYEIQDIAMTLHAAAIRLAAERTEHKKLYEQLKKTLKSYAKAKAVETRVKAVYNFAEVFYLNAGNSRLEKHMHVIQGEQLILRHLYYSHTNNTSRNLADFDRICEAIKIGEVEKAVEIMWAIYDNATPIIIDALATLENKDEVAKKK